MIKCNWIIITITINKNKILNKYLNFSNKNNRKKKKNRQHNNNINNNFNNNLLADLWDLKNNCMTKKKIKIKQMTKKKIL